jgi:hypothetical protein
MVKKTVPPELIKCQQESTNKLNSLIDQYSKQVMCGPDCQREKQTASLKQKYLDAQTNIQQGPTLLRQAKKNYYTYVGGEGAYTKVLQEDLKAEAELIATELQKEFDKLLDNANTMNTYYHGILKSYNNTAELYSNYTNKNLLDEQKIKENNSDILTNDRKSYYEKQQYDNLVEWYRLLMGVFYFIVYIFALGIIVLQSEFSKVKQIVLFLVIFFFPLYVQWLMKTLLDFLNYLSPIKKNVYKTI